MYNSNYEGYMRNVLGYNIMPQDTYSINDSMYEMPLQRNIEITALERVYPEIYRVVYPMIQKVCMKVGNTINEEIIERMTDEVYRFLEEENKDSDGLKRNTDIKTGNSNQTRNRNYLLRDLIKILILRELLGNRPPMRPQMPPPRPPMPPRPPRY